VAHDARQRPGENQNQIPNLGRACKGLHTVSKSLKGHYYFHVPEELQATLVRDLRRERWRGSVLYFPLFLLLGTGFVLLAIFHKGHGLVHWARRIAGPDVTDRQVWLALTALAAVITAVLLVVTLWSMYRERAAEQHLFCKTCPAVDSDDEGVCPVCRRALSERGHFIYTQYGDERKLLLRRGYEGWRGT
jgi:hypothetical protein